MLKSGDYHHREDLKAGDRFMGSNKNERPPLSDAKPKLNAWVRLFPIVFFVSYLAFTVFVFVCGPWPWPVADGTKLYVYLALVHIALLLGYLSAAFLSPRGYYGRWSVRRLVILSLIVNILVFFPTALFRTGKILPNLIFGLLYPGLAFQGSLILRQESTPIIEYIRLILGPLIYPLLPLVVFYWRRLSFKIRIISILSLLSTIALFISMGTNKAIADTILLTPWLILAGHLSGVSRLKRSRRVALVVVSVISIVLFGSFFTATQATRTGSSAYNQYFPSIGLGADPGNFMVRDLPPLVRTGVLGITSYLSQGYYALYLTLDEPFVPMFGVGNSMFLFRQAARITGNDGIMEMPYPMRIEKYGWNAYSNWSTIYPWIASDVSFLGSILVVFLIGRFFALSWLDSLQGANPFAVVVFSQFLIMLFYFSGNNQCLQTGEGFTAFWVLLILWLLTRRTKMPGPRLWSPLSVIP